MLIYKKFFKVNFFNLDNKNKEVGNYLLFCKSLIV